MARWAALKRAATRAEVDYLLRAVQAHFPERRIGEGDVEGAFAGIRPILSSDVQSPSEASREEAIWEERGVLSVAEVRAHLRTGGVVRLEDLLLRRARLGMWRPELARELVGRLRVACHEELGWDHARWDRERDRFERALRGWSLAGVEDTA